MLEILSHQYLKKYMRFQKIDWEHVYSFGRIVSKCISNNATYLINSEIFSTKNWLPAVLISLFLDEKNSIFVLSFEKIEFFKNNQVDDLKNIGFKFTLENDQIIFSNHKVRLITLKNLLNTPTSHRLKNHRIILSGIEDIKEDLKNYFRISLFKKDWFEQLNKSKKTYQNIVYTYGYLKRKFFKRKLVGSDYILLDKKEISFLSSFFSANATYSDQFYKVSKAFSAGWGCWVKLDNKNLEWNFYIEPIDELYPVRDFLKNNKFIFLSSLRRDNFFQKYLKNQKLDIDLVINFKSNFCEREILLYVPPKQILPNNPLFTYEILDKCKKLIIFRKGLSLILTDDAELKNNLATELASIHGKRILMETIPCIHNQILCASYSWWIKNSYLIEIPEQIIIPLLPIPNMSEPINAITVSYKKSHSKDWFREFLLPEAILKLEKSIAPLRRNSGKLIILDGRANKRKWGRLILDRIHPSKKIDYMLPFE